MFMAETKPAPTVGVRRDANSCVYRTKPVASHEG